MASHIVYHSKLMKTLQRDYKLSDQEARNVVALGDTEGKYATYNGHEFHSMMRHAVGGSEYYVPIVGPSGLLHMQYHPEW